MKILGVLILSALLIYVMMLGLTLGLYAAIKGSNYDSENIPFIFTPLIKLCLKSDMYFTYCTWTTKVLGADVRYAFLSGVIPIEE